MLKERHHRQWKVKEWQCIGSGCSRKGRVWAVGGQGMAVYRQRMVKEMLCIGSGRSIKGSIAHR